MFAIAVHHIVSDAWSVSVFARELAALYEAFCGGHPSPLAPLPMQYADYARWQRAQLEGEIAAAQLEYWRRQLAEPSVLELPLDRPRPAAKGHRGAYRAFLVPREIADRLHAIGRQADATLFMVLLAAFQVLLHRHTGQEDVLVGTPIANRGRTDTEPLIGLFINTLVMRSRVERKTTFREVLGGVRRTALEAYANQDVPFELVVDAVQPERSLSRSPLFQVMFVLQHNPAAPLRLGTLAIRPVEIERTTSKFDLTLTIEESGDGLAAGFQYDTDLFDAPTIERLAERFVVLLTAIAGDPDGPVGTLPVMARGEQDLIAAWNETRAALPCVLVCEAFERHAAAAPDAVAVVHGDVSLTADALNRRANRVAHWLIASSIGPEDRVGLYLERSSDALVGILAAWKAGGAYVPIDPTFPPARVAAIVRDAGIRVLLAHRALAARLDLEGVLVACLDDEDAPWREGPEANPDVTAQPASLAYVIYTSGTTGSPKGVAVEHRQLSTYVASVVDRLDLPAAGHHAMVSSFSADLGHTVLFPSLALGATLHVLPADAAADPAVFAAYVARHPIDCLKIVPTHLAMLLGPEPRAELLPRHTLVLGGEASRAAWVEDLHELGAGCAIVNHYGPTETTVGALTWRTERGRPGRADTVPLGRPLPNVRVHVLDGHMQPLPIGVPGEISIGGDAVARGYVNQPHLTADRFVPDPFGGEGGRLYRTGDRGRWLEGGAVEFLGRIDRQVKVRGYRVEVDEIEAALRSHPSVANAAVEAWYAGEPGRPARLAGYVVPAEGVAVAAEDLRSYLLERLPEYMVPASFHLLPALPMTANGKIDRRALPEPDRDRPPLAQAFVAPSTAVEEVLAGIWSEVLEIDSVGLYDNFFELGGHSLSATQVMARVFKVFRLEVPLRRLFERPTIAGLRDALLEGAEAPAAVEETARLLLQLADIPDEELDSQLAGRLADA